jgi:flagellar basal body-associated protein FliL
MKKKNKYIIIYLFIFIIFFLYNSFIIFFFFFSGTINVMHAKVFNDMMENALIVPVKVLKGH